MLISNHEALPQPIVDAVTKDPYSRGESDISVSQLISPARKVALERKHDHEMVIDAADRLFALLGQIGHGILERAANSGIVEKRWFGAMDGWVISGQSDLVLADQKLIDYKFTSVWTVKDGLKPEWEQQMNLLAWLAEAHAQPIKEANIICIFRDWSVLEARRDPTYPQRQVKVLPVPLWGYEKAEAFCRERVRIHAMAQSGNGALPECTAEERWEKSPKWAVMKKGRKRALRLYDTEAEAQKHAQSEKGSYIEHRPGESVRCQSYCNAAPYCDQWKALRGGPDAQEQAEDSGGPEFEAPPPTKVVMQTAKIVEDVDVLVPAGPRQDEFPVEPDVASPGSKLVAKPVVPGEPVPMPTQALTGPKAIVPAPPAELVGRDEPVNVEDEPTPPMPEVTEIPT